MAYSIIIVIINVFTYCVIASVTSRSSSSVTLDRLMHPEFKEIDDDLSVKQTSANELLSEYWITNAKQFVTSQIGKQINKKQAKNIIFFLGDGMSLPTISAVRVFLGGEETQLSFEKFPYVGMSKPYCIDAQTSETACSTTALLCGVKTNYLTIGVNGKVRAGNCTAYLDPTNNLDSIAKWAMNAGKEVGFVTTSDITHATTAALYAHSANRYWQNDWLVRNYGGCDTTVVDDIAEQLINSEVGRKLRVIFGCGRRNFIGGSYVDHEFKSGHRIDEKDLIYSWLQINIDNGKRQYIYNNDGLQKVNISETDYLLGLFDSDNCRYTSDIDDPLNDPTLSEMVDKAIDILNKSENGYFLLVNGGLIDKGHHETKSHYAIEETVELAKAVEIALGKVNLEDTLIVVSADHSHTMTHSGYPSRRKNIFDVAGTTSEDNLPYLILNYANGPGFVNNVDGAGKRLDVSKMNTQNRNFEFPATYNRTYGTHGGDDVPIYAIGPWAHLFNGVLEQNSIPHIISYAACIGNGLKSCDAI